MWLNRDFYNQPFISCICKRGIANRVFFSLDSKNKSRPNPVALHFSFAGLHSLLVNFRILPIV